MAGSEQAATAELDDLLAPEALARANINPTTRLATDYLNHFNNVVMLLDLISAMPECADEVLDWRPLDYPAYFAVSNYRQRDLAIAAYAAAEPRVRDHLVGLVAQLDAGMATAQAMLRDHDPADAETSARLHDLVRGELRPLISEASGVINGTTLIPGASKEIDASIAQESVDELFP